MTMRALHLTSFLAMAIIAAPAAAGDGGFTPDAAATWSARSLLMAKVMDDAAAGQLNKASFATACNGLTGEQMKHEYGKEPRWALAAQLVICSGYDGWAGKFQGAKNPCAMLKKGLKELEGASAASNPPEVVAAGAALRTTVSLLLEATGDHRGACHL
jgi:hypothetical protein